MTEKGRRLVTDLRRVMSTLPGASGTSIFEGRTWSLITVTALTPDAVYTLAMWLGIGEPTERRVATQEGPMRWLYATIERTERGRGLLKIDLVGPREPVASAPTGGAP